MSTTTHPNLQQLATRIHAQNKAAGWWDKPRPRVQTAWLVVTELAEATEAERAGRYADLALFETALEGGSPFEAEFKTHIKDTFEDEIADAVIRLLDFAASENVWIEIDDVVPMRDGTPNEQMFFYVSICLEVYASKPDQGWRISEAIGSLIALSSRNGFDLWNHVDLKLKFNQTRGKMHGGKKF